MPALINGSPTHALVVHAVAVLLPLAVLAALAIVFVPAARRGFGLMTVVVAFVGCIAVPLAFASGSALRQRVPTSPLIDQHVQRADLLLPVAALFGLAVAAFVFLDILRRAPHGELNRVEERLLGARTVAGPWASSQVLSRISAGVVVVVAIATGVLVVLVGDSGAKAAWHGRLTTANAQSLTAAPSRLGAALPAQFQSSP